MSIAAGTRLGRYEIKSLLGAGGMGEGGDPVHTLDWPKDTESLWLSPDGQAPDFIATREGVPNIWRLRLASGREQRLTDWQTTAPLWWFAWSRDGKQLAVTRDTQTNHLVLIQNFRN